MPFITKKHIHRRTFLQGAGVTLALPLLESMIPASTALAQTVAGQPKQRFMGIFYPHGMAPGHWEPGTADGPLPEKLPYILESLKNVKDQTTPDSRRKPAGVKRKAQDVDRSLQQFGGHALVELRQGGVGCDDVPPAVDGEGGKRLVRLDRRVDRRADGVERGIVERPVGEAGREAGGDQPDISLAQRNVELLG